MKAASSAAQTILAAGRYTVAELYDIQLATKYGGQTYHFTDADVAITAAIYPSSTQFVYGTGFTITRGDIVQKTGTDGAQLELTLAPQADSGAGSTSVGGGETIDTSTVTVDTSGVTVDAGLTTAVTGGPTFDSGTITVDSGTVTIDQAGGLVAGAAPTIAGFGLLQAARLGILDGALLTLSKLFFAPGSTDASSGAVKWFVGVVGDVQATRLKTTLKVYSGLSLMTVQMPRSLFGPGCMHQIYDSGCTLARSSFQVSGAVGAASSASKFTTNLTQPDNYFSKSAGKITFTGGLNSGFTASVKSYTHAGGTVQLYTPLPNLPMPGDTFTILPVCNHLLSVCSNNDPTQGPPFNNRAHFKGIPFPPSPETIVDGGTSSPPQQPQGYQSGQIIGSPVSSKFT